MAADFQRQFEEAVRDTEIDEVRKAMQDFHAQASDIKPLMVPKRALPAPAKTAEPASKPEPKPRLKTPKTAHAKKTGTADVDQAEARAEAAYAQAQRADAVTRHSLPSSCSTSFERE
jgi:hypothetical protein